MSRPLPLPARQVEALCRGAARVGYVPVVEIGGVVIRLLPERLVPAQTLDEQKPDPLDAEFAAYEAKYGGD